MNTMCKNNHATGRLTAAIAFCMMLALPLAAEEENIAVSNIITEIEKPDSGINIEADAVPEYELPDFRPDGDFRDLLPYMGTSLPDIADSGMSSADFTSPTVFVGAGSTLGKEASGGDVFIEGAVGAGWPALFSGDFSVYRSKGTEPFSLDFSHVTENGYGIHSAADGFSTSSTSLSGKKRITFGDSLLLDAEAAYSTKVNGLQGLSPVFSSITSQNVTGLTDLTWNINGGMKLSGSLGVVFNNQYAGYNGTLPADLEKNKSGIWFLPRVEYSVKGSVGEDYSWSLGTDLSYEGGTDQQRVEAGISGDFTFGNYGTLDGAVSFVWCPMSDVSWLFPFSLEYKTGSSLLPFTGTVSGGLKSASADISSLQKEVPFMFTGATPYEESVWYASGDVMYPMEFAGKDGQNGSFSLAKLIPALKVSFEKTYEVQKGSNGRLTATGTDPATGLLKAGKQNVTFLNSDLQLDAVFKILDACFLNGTLGWRACWLDEGLYDIPQLLTVKLGVEQLNSNWGAEAGIDITFLGEAPVLNISGFFKLTDSMRLEVKTEDFIKLVTGKDRNLAGEYAGRSGYVAAYVKMFF